MQGYAYEPKNDDKETYTTNPLLTFGLNTMDNNLNYSYYNNDYLGTPKQLTDNKGITVWQAYYKSFGDALVVNNMVTNNLRFPGQYFDGETGLYQNYFRDYNPSLGRYIETGPIGMNGGINNYGYVMQNPIMKKDILGLFSIFGWCIFDCEPKPPKPLPAEECGIKNGNCEKECIECCHRVFGLRPGIDTCKEACY